MKNKILSVVLFLLALATLIFGVTILQSSVEYGWYLIIGSILMALIALVIYRKGVRGVFQAVHDGTPKELR